ncbi:hypothetical protein [Streptomyces sp. ISL-10]|uniref:hypothetical protein n=1 Tax=Streptomyces sp. ISL-10 TaxID=2819172 RepID=UPI0027E4697B|nr:hypothetical protein [Streptomyces sp. ISL-10]
MKRDHRMSGLTKQEQSVIVLRDADSIVAAVRAALDGAAPEERPGLERALEIVEDASATTYEDQQARWVRQRLDAAGVTGPADSIPAIKALREAAPGLSLKSAVDLAKTTRSAESARRGA